MKYYVIAGTRQEFEAYILSKSMLLFAAGETSISLSHFVYVSCPEILRGVENPKGWFIGSFRQRKDIDDIIIALLISKQAFVKTDDFIKLCEEMGFER